RWVRLNSVIITFSGFKSGTCQRYSGRVTTNNKAIKKATVKVANHVENGHLSVPAGTASFIL
ncbi:hypothetical protein ACFICO_000001, partial [Salmonella enterica subsp. enterica serovar Cerro]